MTADDTSGPDPVLEQARHRCATLRESLRRDAAALRRPSRRVAPDALGAGRLAYDHAAAAADALLRRMTTQP